jgi:ectoine hydroxylase-related dioxygenase (phytanoyl-CoA dioxygenase family)
LKPGEANPRALADIDAQGYTVLEDAIEPDLVLALREAIERIARERSIGAGTNEFEGRHTVRLYNLLAEDDVFARVPIHPTVLPVIKGVLDDDCLVSTLSSIDIGPGETPQPIHADDMVIGLPRPHPAIVCNSMWALSDFSEENGATRLVPGSHKTPESPNLAIDTPSIPAEMKAGSVLVWHGSLWHGGGENRTRERRVGLAMNYCAGFIRQQENQQLGIPRKKVATFPRRLQRLVGYGVYRSLIGHIDKRSPATLLDRESESKIVWDR